MLVFSKEKMAGKLSSLFLLVLVSGLGTAIFLGIAFKDDERSPTDIFMHHAFSRPLSSSLFLFFLCFSF